MRLPGDPRPLRAALIVCLFCLTLTTLSAWAAARADDTTERRLLQVQSKQAAAALSTAILLIQQPLVTALSVEDVAGEAGDAGAFRRVMSTAVGPGRPLTSASLWHRGENGSLVQVGQVGPPTLMPLRTAAGRSFLDSAFDADTFRVRLVTNADGLLATAYALADRRSGFVVHAERRIPPNRRSPVDRDAAFADLHYAVYVGDQVADEALATTDLAASRLPLEGETYRTTIPFGDTVLTFVTSPRRHLGAGLSQALPLFLLLGGVLITAVATRSAHQLVRSRQQAEQITDVQRDISVRLQRAVLPHVNPDIPRLEIASEYLAGTRGVDIGGDWYSIIALDEEHFGFVVGDVSGHGVDAVAVMAHARFTLRAYLLDGKSPEDALAKCARQFDITTDGHMTTAVVGVGNWVTGETVLANAGHPPPLRITEDGADFVSIPTGPPLGTGPTSYRSTTIRLEPGDTLLAFTDGLVERRRESIDAGLQRLLSAATEIRHERVADLVQHAIDRLHHADSNDDIAVLAFRRSDGDTQDGHDPGGHPMSHREWPADSHAPAAARAFVAEQLRRKLQPGAAPELDEVVLVTSELVTNAVRAEASRVSVDVIVDGARIDLVVCDDAGGWPAVRHVGTDALGGRGLAIVEQLAESWSARPAGRGKAVTASWLVSLPH